MKVEVAYSKMQHCSTLDAHKNSLNDIKTVFDCPQHDNRKKQSFNKSNHVFSKGRNTKCFRVKANKKTTIIPSKISSANECNKTIALLPRFEFAQIFEHD